MRRERAWTKTGSAFVIPKYLQERCPDPDSIGDLKQERFGELFSAAETGGKARPIPCVIGRACEEVNARQIEGYGLSEHVHIINPGDGAAADADLCGAHESGQPRLGYRWGADDPAVELALALLDEPPYGDECWFAARACAYEPATFLIAVHPDLFAAAPEVVAVLCAWDVNIGRCDAVGKRRRQNEGVSISDTALRWLNNVEAWTGWVTGEAAGKISSALAESEVAEGWPTERLARGPEVQGLRKPAR